VRKCYQSYRWWKAVVSGGSAPKHVQQFNEEGHLRWDSLGEFLALAASYEHLAESSSNAKATVLSETLDTATGLLLDEGKSPQRKVGQLDNRGSHYYLAKFWAQELSTQTTDADLAVVFKPVAEALAAKESEIVSELDAAQGKAVDIAGYYFPSSELANAAMRPSSTKLYYWISLVLWLSINNA